MTGRVNLKIQLAPAFFLLLFSGIADAVEIHVPSQYTTIQDAINAAVNGDTVIVAPGTYTGSGNRDLDFGGKAIIIRSTDPNDPNIVATTIIDCQGTRSTPHRGFYFHGGENTASVLNGLIITNGYVTDGYGGGIRCNSSSPAITNCIFVGNSAITDKHGSWGFGYGGGMFNSSSSPTITNCSFSGNSASGDGGGIANSSSNPTIINCTFSRNSASRGGGGINNAGCGPTITNCTLSGNSADQGGGIYNNASSPTIINCTFIDNSASRGGGGVENSSILDNPPSSSTITNCILWGNTAPNGSQIDNTSGSTATVTFSDVQGGYSGTGNINADPCFVNAAGGNFHLLPDSPCINAGDPAFVPEPNETDIDGEPRVMLGRVDMGADEFNPFDIDFIVINKRRIGRTIFEYDCEASLTNISRFAVRNVALKIIKASENMVIIDPNVTFGVLEIAPGQSATSLDTCTFRLDRSRSTDPAKIIWQSTCDISGTLGEQYISGISLLPLSAIPGDIDHSGKVNFEDVEILADQWLQPPGSPSADVFPLPIGDNFVDFLDFALLAQNWLRASGD